MMIFHKILCWISILLLTTVGLFEASDNATQNAQQSCRSFVARFYKWYFSIVQKDTKESPLDLTLKYKPAAFSPELFRMLKEDTIAAKKQFGDWLDFDPFLFGQEP